VFYALTGIRRQVELKNELLPVPSSRRWAQAHGGRILPSMTWLVRRWRAMPPGQPRAGRRGRHRATEAAGIKAVEGICRGARQRPWRHMWATPLGAKVTWASNPSGSSPMDPPRESSLFRQSFREGDEASCPRVDKMWFRLAAFTCRWMRRDKSKGIKRKKK
jgi:hypothetical protein